MSGTHMVGKGEREFVSTDRVKKNTRSGTTY